MPAIALPPVPYEAPASSGAGRLSQAEADEVLLSLQSSLKATRFVKAWPSPIPGLAALRMESGQVAYADKSGRYFFLGLVFDTATGVALDGQMDATTKN